MQRLEVREVRMVNDMRFHGLAVAVAFLAVAGDGVQYAVVDPPRESQGL